MRILEDKNIQGRDCPKGGGIGMFADLRGELDKKEGVVFLRGESWDPNAHHIRV